MKKILGLGFLCLGVCAGLAQAQLKIDFGQTNGAVEAGYQGYFAADKNVASFTAQSYQAFDTTVTIKPTWGPGAVAAALRMIDRGVTDVIEAPSLMRDWIGTDTRSAGDPMTLTISGLPLGMYEWVSYHHDRNDQTGIFQVTVNDAAGARTTKDIDISNGTNFKLADVTKFTTRITANGKSDVTLVFDQTSASSPTAVAIFVMNAFELTSIEAEMALAPVPSPEATDVRRDGTVLSWWPSKKAVKHDVYLGTDHDDIDDGTTASAVYQGRQDANSFDPGRLELGRTYFWRVDEVAADGTVFKGDVWSFTVEPVNIALTRAQIVAATASSSNTTDEGPEKTIDGSGLDAGDLHSIDKTAMWINGAFDPGPVWIQYKFDRVYKLQELWAWNYNVDFEPVVGYGCKDVTIEYSLDGAAWTVQGDVQFAQATGRAGYAHNTTLDLGGVQAQYVRLTIRSNWSTVNIKQCGLSEVRFLVAPVSAREPQPASGATGVDPRLGLSWRAGREAAKHQVYLSTDVNEVINGTTLAGTISEPRLDADGSLALGRTYYWKVNEVNDVEDPSVWEGAVWSFSTMASLPVDDMESYNDATDQGTRIYEVWLDGWDDPANDSQVGHTDPPFAELTTVHGGRQAMPFYYDNATASYSEATRTFDEPQDWTAHGVKALTLWFYGDPCNTAVPMYVKVNGRKVTYDGDTTNLLRKPWQLWYVDLGGLTGVNLNKVTELALGFEGGQGRVFFDDIALSAGDRQLVTPVKPEATGLVAHYAFEGDTKDKTGAHPATAIGAPTFVAGPVGQAIRLDGARDHVEIEGPFDLPVYSAALWFRVEGGTAERDLLSGYNATGGHGILLEVRGNGELRYLHRSPLGTGGGTNIYSGSDYSGGAWYHVAIVKSADTMTLYLNGARAGSASDSTVFDNSLAKLTLGILKHDGQSRRFPGAIDEVYLYSRELSQAEIAWLAGRTTPFDKP